MATARNPRRRRAFSQGRARPSATQSNHVSRLDPTRRRAADWSHSARVVENPGRKIHRSFTRTADALSDRSRLSYRDQNWSRAGKQGRGRHHQRCPAPGRVKRSRLPRDAAAGCGIRRWWKNLGGEIVQNRRVAPPANLKPPARYATAPSRAATIPPRNLTDTVRT